ncbi:MAG: UDP-glucose--hexose-1-phosphate uridylyltransferase [Steroidobacterales bacterium]
MNSTDLDLQSDVHRRLNPLTGEWVLVSPHRSARPWQGQTETPALAPALAYDPACYLCPGNRRADRSVNPPYESTFVFDNDFPALRPQGPTAHTGVGTLLQAQGETGRCRVICYTPRHDLTLGQMPVAGIRTVIDTWAAQTSSLGAETFVNAVTIFENRGAIMGASNPHPHGQIWTNDSLPNEMARESTRQADYLHERGTCLLCDYAALELTLGERIVCVNDEFVAVVPFWAVWPFEVIVMPRRHAVSIDALDAPGRDGFAQILKDLTRRYDGLFDIVFPYTMGLHQRPTDGEAHAGWHLHAHFYPPLLRSASVRKFMVGYEMLAGPQRDITPESAAVRLREVRLT